MSGPRPDDARVLAELEHVAREGARVLRAERRHRVLVGLSDTLSRRLWIGAAGAALVLLGGAAALPGLVVLGVAAAAALLGLWNALTATTHVDEADALGRLDHDLGLADRLLTARDFLGRPARTGFMRAAIEDATDAVERARAARLEPRVAPARWSRAGKAGFAAAVLLLVAGAALRSTAPDTADEGGGPVETARAPRAAERRVDEPARTMTPAPEDPEPETADADRPAGAPEAAESTEAGRIPKDSRESRGATGEGKSAEAAASRGAGQSKGMPSAQGQVSVPDPKERKPRKRKESKEPDATPTPQKKPGEEERSGSTAGSGAASGSNRNPSTSEWSSKDQVSETDDDPVEDDSDVDDEDSDSEARGGLQPNLRDRRPPVNRDLSIGFGNEADEESNGRGGPGQAKKSRGTASLVLGVPIPDHVKGQPNPGRTKITQERVEPQDDEAPDVPAADRGARSGAPGHVARPTLAPWMRTLVRAYFLTRNAQESQKP